MIVLLILMLAAMTVDHVERHPNTRLSKALLHTVGEGDR